MSDFTGVVPAITGKVELVYEGEQEGPGIVAQTLIGKAIRSQFDHYFPNPEELRKKKEKTNPYKPISKWFNDGNQLDLLHDDSEKEYQMKLKAIPGLEDLVKNHHKKIDSKEALFMMEFALHGMAEYSLLSKHALSKGHSFKDLLSSMLNFEDSTDSDEDFNI
jgi:magnesium chelatase subunit I